MFEISGFKRRHIAWLACILLLVLFPAFGEAFYTRFGSRILIYALAAISLDLLLGYGGMVSFGHAAFIGLGAYTVGILTTEGMELAFVSWPLAILAGGLGALVIGALSLRTVGIYFIMITLAFSQMLFYLANSLQRYGGDDGKGIAKRNSFTGLIDIKDEVSFYYVTLVLFLICFYIAFRLVNSRFGMVVRGAQSNDMRMQSIGFPTYRYRLLMFVIAGAMAGLSGALMTNLNAYFSPSYFEWFLSGVLLIMVIFGGSGTLYGPAIGAAVYMILEEVLSSLTVHWMVVFGPLLLIVVLFANRGIYGWIERSRTG